MLVAVATLGLLGGSPVLAGDEAAGSVKIGVLGSPKTRLASARGQAGTTGAASCDASGCDSTGGCNGCDEPAGRYRLGSCLSGAFDHYDDCWYQYGDGWYECTNGCCYGGACGETYECCGNGNGNCNGNGCSNCGAYGCNGACDGRDISAFRRRNEQACRRICDHFAERFAYFHPSGCGGAGCPPFGHYHRTYAVNPSHFDQRDGRVYAAQGAGIPMAVPLAPNVNYTYNYGWGVPSSRLTQVSRPLPFMPIVTP